MGYLTTMALLQMTLRGVWGRCDAEGCSASSNMSTERSTLLQVIARQNGSQESPPSLGNCPQQSAMTDMIWQADPNTHDSCIGKHTGDTVARHCVNAEGQVDRTSLFVSLANLDDTQGCFAWQVGKCQFKVEDISIITFVIDWHSCAHVWAAPIWMSPRPWCGPYGDCKQGHSGEIDMVEMCNGKNPQTSYGCYNAYPWANCQNGAWERWNSAADGPQGGPKRFAVHFDHSTRKSFSEVCEPLGSPDGSNCIRLASYDNYLGLTHGGKYKEPYHFISDVWNSRRVNGCLATGESYKDTHSKCTYAVTDIQIWKTDGEPYFSDSSCAPLNANCASYMNETGCGWTSDWNCPGQSAGSQGESGDPSSTGHMCCCTMGLWQKAACASYMNTTGCGWTSEWNCPAQPAGSQGHASLGSMGYMCCCTEGLWQQVGS